MDVCVFNPCAPLNANSVSSAYRRHENIKRRAYGQQIREVEHASFTLLVLSATGGLISEAITFYKRFASLLSAKWGDEYCVVMGWIRCCLFFALLSHHLCPWSSIVIGTFFTTPPSLDLIRVESQMIVDTSSMA